MKMILLLMFILLVGCSQENKISCDELSTKDCIYQECIARQSLHTASEKQSLDSYYECLDNLGEQK